MSGIKRKLLVKPRISDVILEPNISESAHWTLLPPTHPGNKDAGFMLKPIFKKSCIFLKLGIAGESQNYLTPGCKLLTAFYRTTGALEVTYINFPLTSSFVRTSPTTLSVLLSA